MLIGVIRVDWFLLLCQLRLQLSEFKPDRCQGQKSKSSSQLYSNCGKGKSTPAFSVNTTWGISSTRALNAKKHQVDSHTDGDLDAPLTRKDIPAIVKAVMDSMPGESTHQLSDEMDTVEQPGELDIQ